MNVIELDANRYYEGWLMYPDGRQERKLFFNANEQDVRREVSRMGATLLDVTTKHRTIWNREYYSRDYKTSFLKALAFHVDVGTSAGHALRLVIETEANQSKRAEMQPALEILNSGGRFSDALAMLPFIDRPISALLEAGDITGYIKEAVHDAIALMEKRKGIWKTITATFGWIVFDMFSMVSTVYTMQWVAIPWLRDHPPKTADQNKILEFNARLDQVEMWNMLLTIFTTLVCVGFTAAVVAFFFGSNQTKDKISHALVKLPLLRRVFMDGSLADSFLLLGRMTKNGVPLVRSMDILANFTSITIISSFWLNVRQSIIGGWDTVRAFQAGGLLSRQELIVMAAHQDRQQLAKIMESMSENRQGESERGVRQFVTWSVVLTIMYMMVVMGMAMWLLTVQDMGLGASFDDLMNGGF